MNICSSARLGGDVSSGLMNGRNWELEIHRPAPLSADATRWESESDCKTKCQLRDGGRLAGMQRQGSVGIDEGHEQ